jgi:hypothetical protein
MKAVCGLPAAGLLLAGCLRTGGTTVDDCTSSYRRVAQAPRLGALTDDLTDHVPPKRRSPRTTTAPRHLASPAVLTQAGFALAGSVELGGPGRWSSAAPRLRFVRGLTVDDTGRRAR